MQFIILVAISLENKNYQRFKLSEYVLEIFDQKKKCFNKNVVQKNLQILNN